MRLYKAAYVVTDDEWEFDGDDWLPEPAAPEGWDDYCMERWGESRDFYPPSDRKVYRSRSSAQARVDLINRWLGDGTAILVETETNWMPTTEANKRRAARRAMQRIAKLQDHIDAIASAIDDAHADEGAAA